MDQRKIPYSYIFGGIFAVVVVGGLYLTNNKGQNFQSYLQLPITTTNSGLQTNPAPSNLQTVAAPSTLQANAYTCTSSNPNGTCPNGDICNNGGCVVVENSSFGATLNSETRGSQYIPAAPAGAPNGSIAVIDFIANANNAPSTATINELKFNVHGSDGLPSKSITSVSLGTLAAMPVNGVVDFKNLNMPLTLQDYGQGFNFYISYNGVGAKGVRSGTTSSLTLNYMNYQMNGVTSVNNTQSVTSPTMTLVGSIPSLWMGSSPSQGSYQSSALKLNANNQISKLTVAAAANGSIKLHKFQLHVDFADITNPAISSGTLVLKNDANALPKSWACTYAAPTITCEDNVPSDDVLVTTSNPLSLNLSATITGTAGASSSPSITTYVVPDTGVYVNNSGTGTTNFLWNDVAGGATAGLYDNGSLITNFPIPPGTGRGGKGK